MANESILTQEDLERLLAWLNPEREQAGIEYEHIRESLINIFTWRGCSNAEDLADETIDRVAKKVEELTKTYSGKPALYFYGVAKKIALEDFRRESVYTMLPSTDLSNDYKKGDNLEIVYECLDKCRERLSPEDRDLISLYYEKDKGAKIANRRELADRLGLDANALRVKAYRIRMLLQKCVQTCIEQNDC